MASDGTEAPPPLLVETGKDGVVRVTLNRPDRRNALSHELVEALDSALRDADRDPEAKVVLLTGAGDRAFSAGGDLSGGDASAQGFQARHERGRSFASLLRTMRDIGLPIVARVNGYALGGGFGLLLACDFSIAPEDAKVGTPEINVGLFPMMIMALVMRTLPRRRAMEMMMLGQRVTAAEARDWGIFTRVVPREELDGAVDDLVGRLASKSRAVLRLGRRAIQMAPEMPYSESLEFLNAMLTVNSTAEDAMEGIMAFFQKRPPDWKGR